MYKQIEKMKDNTEKVKSKAFATST